MHVRVRLFGKPDAIVVVESKLTKIEQLRNLIKDKFNVEPKLQLLFYGGKLLENGYTFYDYNIKLNDVIQLMTTNEPVTHKVEEKSDNKTQTKKNVLNYIDTESTLYLPGDLVDIKDRANGAWYEAKILNIVLDPNTTSATTGFGNDTGNALENKPSSSDSNNESKSKKKDITKYFSTQTNRKMCKVKSDGVKINDENLLYRVQLEADQEDSNLCCKFKEIRPRAKREVDIKDVKVGQTYMINHNTDDPLEIGDWYDFKVDKVNKLRTRYELIGTLYLGPDSVPHNDTKVPIHDKIFVIEQPVPITERTEEFNMIIPEKRSKPLYCLKCRDDKEVPCNVCGCSLCSGKETPEKIVLCDECNLGFHMDCLSPPLMEIPDEDWYCPSCKRDPNDVIAPGAAKQTKKKNSKTNKDWGRGMACVGKTKTCAMPANHFGPIPGIEVGMCWRFRIQLSESGVHRPPVSGIHGRDIEGAYSIVLSGGYEDDYDNGNEFTYTGSGGRDLSGNKRTAEQSCDQTLTRENRALARNCAVKEVNENGADAGNAWKEGKPVRVVRSYKMFKHFPKYAPKEGIRYDGIYKVVKYYPEKGLSGYRVWKYLLRRDDPIPAPWEPGAKHFPIVYPDGYLEAEAEKKAQKEKKSETKVNKKRPLRENNQTSLESETSPPSKKRETRGHNKENGKESEPKIPSMFLKTRNFKKKDESGLSPEEKASIKVDTLNSKQKENKSETKVNKKRGLRESNQTSSESETSPPSKKCKTQGHKKKNEKASEPKIPKDESGLSPEERASIKADTLNSKLWDECLQICETQGKKEFIDHVTQVFLCIICREVAVSPVTTPCLHNFCMVCLKLAFKSTESQSCPCCRQNVSKMEVTTNDELMKALRTILTGYDLGKK